MTWIYWPLVTTCAISFNLILLEDVLSNVTARPSNCAGFNRPPDLNSDSLCDMRSILLRISLSSLEKSKAWSNTVSAEVVSFKSWGLYLACGSPLSLCFFLQTGEVVVKDRACHIKLHGVSTTFWIDLGHG